MGESVRFSSNGGTCDGYLARPAAITQTLRSIYRLDPKT